MKSWMRWALVVAGVVLLIMLLRATAFRPRPIEVQVAVAERGTVEDVVTNSQAGTVRARRRSRLGAERAGRVTAIPFRESARVRRGAVLVQLDASTARTALDLARRERDVQRAQVESARAAYALARIEHERAQSLHAQDVISQGEMDRIRTRFEEARAALAAAEATTSRADASVRLADDDLAHLQIAAPYDGVVAQRLVEVGESVVPGQPVIEIVSPESLYVSAGIDEVDIGRLHMGLPARVTLDPYRGLTWSGRVSRVFPVVDDRLEQNRTLTVEVDVDPAPDRPQPLPGTSADIVIVLDERSDVLRVPTFAVIEGRRVLVVENGRAVAREVTTGLRNWQWTEITGGLEAGEPVITNLDKQGVKAGVAVKATSREDANAAP
jgi:HlyD family secretion protein